MLFSCRKGCLPILVGVSVNSAAPDISLSRTQWQGPQGDRHRNVERCSGHDAGRATDFKLSGEFKWAVTCRGRNLDGLTVTVHQRELKIVTLVRLIPGNLNLQG